MINNTHKLDNLLKELPPVKPVEIKIRQGEIELTDKGENYGSLEKFSQKNKQKNILQPYNLPAEHEKTSLQQITGIEDVEQLKIYVKKIHTERALKKFSISRNRAVNTSFNSFLNLGMIPHRIKEKLGWTKIDLDTPIYTIGQPSNSTFGRNGLAMTPHYNTADRVDRFIRQTREGEQLYRVKTVIELKPSAKQEKASKELEKQAFNFKYGNTKKTDILHTQLLKIAKPNKKEDKTEEQID